MAQIAQPDIIKAVEAALTLKAGTLAADSRAEDVAHWDSLGQLSILVALDKLFEGKIANINEMAEADSVPKILKILQQHSLM
jgi:acyl carrier protein